MKNIWKLDTHADDEGRTVVSRTFVMGDAQPTEVPLYFGSAMIKTSKGVLPIEFPFPPTVTTISAAFETFDESMKAFIETKQLEAKTRIITPNDAPSLIG